MFFQSLVCPNNNKTKVQFTSLNVLFSSHDNTHNLLGLCSRCKGESELFCFQELLLLTIYDKLVIGFLTDLRVTFLSPQQSSALIATGCGFGGLSVFFYLPAGRFDECTLHSGLPLT